MEKDTEPGVLLKAKKPLNWKQRDLEGIELYSIILNKRISFIPEKMPIFTEFKIKLGMAIHRAADMVRSH